MNLNVLKVKGFNLSVYLLMGFQFAILISIVIILISIMSRGFASFDTVVSAVVLFMLGLPILILLYRSSNDRVMKTILLGQTLSYTLLSVSGIIWYILAGTFSMQWLVSIAKIIMIVSYVPIFLALYKVFMTKRKSLAYSIKAFVSFIGIGSILIIGYFTLINSDLSNWFNIGSYLTATVFDILILTLSVLLIFIYAPTQIRYIMAIIFIYVSLSFIGDFLNLLTALRYEAPVSPQIFYDAMLLFVVGAYIVFSFFRDIDTTTVEEVNKKLDDTRHFMDDIIMQSPDAVCIFDTEGNAVTANEPFLSMFMTSNSRIIGKFNLFRHLAESNCSYYNEILKLKQGNSITVDRLKIDVPARNNFYISMKLFPTYSTDGTISGIVSVCDDITARIKTEEELKQSEELAELYMDLMGHDINNMNQIGIGYLELALSTLNLEDNNNNKLLLAKPLEAMENSSRLIGNVKKLRALNTSDPCLQQVDLGKVLLSVIKEHGRRRDERSSSTMT